MSEKPPKKLTTELDGENVTLDVGRNLMSDGSIVLVDRVPHARHEGSFQIAQVKPGEQGKPGRLTRGKVVQASISETE